MSNSSPLSSGIAKKEEAEGIQKKKKKRGDGSHQEHKVLSINIIKAYMDSQNLGIMSMTFQIGISCGL